MHECETVHTFTSLVIGVPSRGDTGFMRRSSRRNEGAEKTTTPGDYSMLETLDGLAVSY